MPKLTKDGLELSIATQRTRANLGELDVTVAIPGFINLCELALKGLETTRPEVACILQGYREAIELIESQNLLRCWGEFIVIKLNDRIKEIESSTESPRGKQ